jgi:hypothetical protein
MNINMKRNIILLFVLLAFTRCDEWENSAEPSSITYLPKVEVNGDSYIELDCDADSYDDEGATAIMAGEEVEYNTTVAGRYFGGNAVDGPDFYDIVYSKENEDGIPGVAFREVFWPECNGDLVNSIAGVYTANVTRNGVISAEYMGIGPIIIRDLGNNQYALSDAIGGYYDYGRAYGAGYASTGMIITANNIAANDFSFGDPVPVGAFGGSNEMLTFTVNPGAKKIVFTTTWDAGYDFSVELTQVPQ